MGVDGAYVFYVSAFLVHTHIYTVYIFLNRTQPDFPSNTIYIYIYKHTYGVHTTVVAHLLVNLQRP